MPICVVLLLDEDQEEVTPGISVVDPEESNQTEEAQEENDGKTWKINILDHQPREINQHER